MPKIFLIVIAGFLLLSCNDGKIKNKPDLERLKLNGEVKRISKTFYKSTLAFGEFIKVKAIDGEQFEHFAEEYFRELHFNTAGYITKSILYNDANVLLNQWNFEYDDDGRILKKSDVHGCTVAYNYMDKEHKSIETRHPSVQRLHGWRPEVEIIKTYNETNERILKSDITENNKILKREVFEFNDNNELHEVETYIDSLDNGKITSITNYSFKEGKLDFYSFTSGPFPISYNLKYNEEGDIISCEESELDMFNGENYEHIRPKTFSYKYDKQGNWVERVSFLSEYPSGEPDIMTVRKIEYY